MSAKNFILFTVLGALLFIPFLGQVHLFDWDEINFAESAREMLATGNFSRVQINFQPFWEKPPLFIWLQSLSMYIFGVNEFAARLPNALVGIASLLTIFYVGSKQVDTRMGWLWVLCYIGSFLPHFYFKSGIIDPLFNLFIFCGIVQFTRLTSLENFTRGKRMQLSALAGLFIGLAILTKGPVALLVVLVCLFFYWASMKFMPFMKSRDLLIFLVVAALISFVWFGLETIKNGPWFIVTFIQYQVRLLTTEDAGHGGPVFYHFVVLLLGCFPASVFLLRSYRNELSSTYEIRNFRKWMLLLLIVVLFIFSIVKTKIVHYSSLAYFPLTFLAAYYIHKLLYLPGKKINAAIYISLLIIGLVISLVFIAAPFIGMHPQLLEPYIKDAFGKANLQANVHWSGLESLVGFFYLVMIILSLLFLRKKERRAKGILVLFASSAVTIQLALYIFVPKIEGYSQRAAIEFYQQVHKEHPKSYVEVLGYKSYAQLFYTAKQMPADSNLLNRDSLLNGYGMEPAFFVSKIDRAEGYIKDHSLVKIGEKNGFVFLKKE